jgi:acyl carrier protein
MDNNLFEQIKQFVIFERGKYRFTLTFETTLEGDLHITGDDAIEFIVAFGKRFNIDVSNFDFVRYFGGEGELWGLTWKLPTPNKLPITLRDLYNAALTGSMPCK